LISIREAWTYAHAAYHMEDLPSGSRIMVHGDDCGYYRVTEDGKLVIGFMGTGTLGKGTLFQKIRDWVSNLNAFDRNKNGIHDGFDKAVAPFLADIQNAIINIPHSSVLFTGHSRGGALAVLAAHYINVKCYVVTFAAPGQGDAEFIIKVNLNDNLSVINVRVGEDCVPTLPPGTEHSGETIWLKKKKWRGLPLIRRFYNIADHLPDSSYEKTIFERFPK